jgi:hypothetical protein
MCTVGGLRIHDWRTTDYIARSGAIRERQPPNTSPTIKTQHVT